MKRQTDTETNGTRTSTAKAAPRRAKAETAATASPADAEVLVTQEAAENQPVKPKPEAIAPEGEAAVIPAGMQLPEGVEARVFDPADLEPWPGLPTRDAGDYQPEDPEMVDLVASMKAHAAATGLPYGNFEPAAVHLRPDGRHWIVAGRRRWTGAGLSGLKVLAIARVWTEAEAHVTALAENIHHKRITYLAEAQEIALLRDTFGMDQEEIGRKIGKGQSYVSKRLTVLAMPAWVRAAIERGEMSPSVAYDGLGVYVAVPEPAAAELWTRAEGWYVRIRQARGRPTAEQIRQAVGDIAVSLSRTMDPSAGYRGEETPVFDVAAHDAACGCGRPRIAIQPMFREHARCYAVPVWLRLQAAAKEQRSAELRDRARSGSKAGGRAASPGAAQVESTAASTTPQERPTIVAAEPMESPAPMLPAWDVPTWAEYMAGREGLAQDYSLTGDEALENFRHVRRDLLDWTVLPAAALRFVQAPGAEGEGVFRIVCDDAEAVAKAREAARREVYSVATMLCEQAQAALRTEVSTVDARSAAALAVVLYELPQAGRWFVQQTAVALGIGFDNHTTATTLGELPKNKLILLLQGIAWRYLNNKTGNFVIDPAQEATQQVYDRQAGDFAAVLDGLPFPEPTPAGRVQQLAGLVEARWEAVQEVVRPQEPGGLADELPAYAREWSLNIIGFRAAVEAVEESAEAGGVDPARVANIHGEGTVAEMLAEARELLSHPILAEVEAEAERQTLPPAAAEEDMEGSHDTNGDPPTGDGQPARPSVEPGEVLAVDSGDAAAESRRTPASRAAESGGGKKGKR